MEKFMSLKALRAVATRYQNLADATNVRAEKREYLAAYRETMAKVAKLEKVRVSESKSANHLTAIALKARCTRLENLAKGTRGKARKELMAQLRETEKRIAA